MATVTLTRITGRIGVDNGQDAEGNVKIKYISAFGDLNEAYFTSNMATGAAKLLTIAQAIGPILSKTLESIEVVEYNSITA